MGGQRTGSGEPRVDVRRVQVGLPPGWLEAIWREQEQFAVSQASADLEDFITRALKAEGLEAQGALVLVRHGPGQRGLPPLSSAGRWGFALDLTEARRTMDGGLLLFAEPPGHVRGWRAEAGMMTLWRTQDPDLTELAPGSPDRITLLGQARALEV